MKTLSAVLAVAAVAFGSVVFPLAVPVVQAARPGTEQQLVQQLNGVPVRFVTADGGRSGVFSSGALGCMPLADAGAIQGGVLKQFSPNVLLFVPKIAGNFCLRPSAQSQRWDGGCNFLPSDENYGVPVAAGVPQYMTPDQYTSHFCFITDAGSMAEAVWTVQ